MTEQTQNELHGIMKQLCRHVHEMRKAGEDIALATVMRIGDEYYNGGAFGSDDIDDLLLESYYGAYNALFSDDREAVKFDEFVVAMSVRVVERALEWKVDDREMNIEKCGREEGSEE